MTLKAVLRQGYIYGIRVGVDTQLRSPTMLLVHTLLHSGNNLVGDLKSASSSLWPRRDTWVLCISDTIRLGGSPTAIEISCRVCPKFSFNSFSIHCHLVLCSDQ
jgi:hypothetical protein